MPDPGRSGRRSERFRSRRPARPRTAPPRRASGTGFRCGARGGPHPDGVSSAMHARRTPGLSSRAASRRSVSVEVGQSPCANTSTTGPRSLSVSSETGPLSICSSVKGCALVIPRSLRVAASPAASRTCRTQGRKARRAALSRQRETTSRCSSARARSASKSVPVLVPRCASDFQSAAFPVIPTTSVSSSITSLNRARPVRRPFGFSRARSSKHLRQRVLDRIRLHVLRQHDRCQRLEILLDLRRHAWKLVARLDIGRHVRRDTGCKTRSCTPGCMVVLQVDRESISAGAAGLQ